MAGPGAVPTDILPLPTVTVPLPTVTAPLPTVTVTVPLPTVTVPPLPTLPPPTVTVPLPTVTVPPLPTVPLPTVTVPPLPTVPLPTVTVPPLPTVPLPTVTVPPLPTLPLPTPPSPTATPTPVPGELFIRLKIATFDPLVGEPDLPASLRYAEEAAAAAGTYLVQFRNPILPAWRAALAATGVQIVNYVPDHAYLVRLPADGSVTLAILSALPNVRWVGPFHPAYRVSPMLLDQQGSRDLRVKLLPGATRTEMDITAAAVTSWGGRVLERSSGNFPLLIVRLNLAELPNLAAIPAVEWIEPVPERVLHNTNAAWTVQSGQLDHTPLWDNGLSGAGQVATVADTGLDYWADPTDPDPWTSNLGLAHWAYRDTIDGGVTWLKADYEMTTPGSGNVNVRPFQRNHASTDHRKVVAYFDLTGDGHYDGGPSGHGDHVSGSVAADAPPYGQPDLGDGMAYGARLAFQDVGTDEDGLGGLPASMYDMINQVYDIDEDGAYTAHTDARVHSNSWGSILNVTILDAQALDQFVWEHPDMIVTVSAGNGGPGAGSVGEPATAKNNIAVGGNYNGGQYYSGPDSMTDFSSHGPSSDGRRKPDLSAPGAINLSPDSDTDKGLQTMQGTSMSNPLLAGVATQVRQYFCDGYYPDGVADRSAACSGMDPTGEQLGAFNPTAALVKAVMTNGARRLTGQYTADDNSADPNVNAGQWPSNGQGWGRIVLDDALYFPDDSRLLWVKDDATGLNTLDTATYTFTVPSGQPFKVVLAYSDYYALAGNDFQLVDNLDLQVTSPPDPILPLTYTYLGNNMDTQTAGAGNGESLPVPVGVPDALNNVEVVNILNPTAGVWTITVLGTNVPEGPQPYALAVTYGNPAAPPPPADGIPPVISNVAFSPDFVYAGQTMVEFVSDDTAVITWQTDEPATSFVHWGPTPGTYPNTISHAGTAFPSADLVTNHRVIATGLPVSTTVYFQLESTDASG
ncbi:MAG: hypothetical protein CVU38_04275, partial [Chloroflexi bacterium HGW-Chloroflexi-1]